MNLKGQPPKDQKLSSNQKRSFEKWRDTHAQDFEKKKWLKSFKRQSKDQEFVQTNPQYKLDTAIDIVNDLAKLEHRYNRLKEEDSYTKTKVFRSIMNWLETISKSQLKDSPS